MSVENTGAGGRLGGGFSLRPRARWLGRSLLLATLAIGLIGGVSDAQARWSPAARVLGESHFGNPVVAFDAQDTPWVAWSLGPEKGITSSGLFVARLTGRYRLAAVHRVPGPHLEELQSNPAFAVDSAGFGVLAWRYVTEYGVAGSNGAALTTWRLGGAPNKRVELIAPTGNEVGPVSVATNRHGDAIVMYSQVQFPYAELTTRIGRIDAARLSAGQVLAQQQVATITGGPTALNVQVAPGIAEGFQATWELEGGEAEHFAALGADTSHTAASGVFSRAQLTPFPPGLVQAPYSPEQIASDRRGDQVVWWTTGQESRSSPQNLYVASRRYGESFSAPQLVGRTEYLGRPDIVINRGGRVTIAWTQREGKKLAALTAAGQVGGKLNTPRLLTTGLNLGGLELVLTQSGEAVAAWWQELASGEVLGQAAASADGTRFTTPRTIFRKTARSTLACGGPSLWPDRRNGVLAGWTCSTPGHGQHQVEEFAQYQP
jgi:hypothetical protein